MKVLAVYAIKGGVGKTSAAVNLAWLARREGRRTLLWDLDPQGAATDLLGVRDKVKGGTKGLVKARLPLSRAVRNTPGGYLDVIPANLGLRHIDLVLDAVKRPSRRIGTRLNTIDEEYDVVVLDCPPSVSLVSENILNAADLVLVPLVPATLSVRTLAQLDKLIGMVTQHRPPVLVFLSMADRRRALHRDLTERLRVERSDLAMTAIPLSAAVERMAERKKPIVGTSPKNPASLAYEELWIEVANRLWPLGVHSLHYGD